MKILFINSVYGLRSTGRLIAEQCRKLEAEGHHCVVAYGREAVDTGNVRLVRIGSDWDQRLHGLRSRLLDQHGFGSKWATRRFLNWAEQEKFDLIWLHNIHGYYLNIGMLFQFIKQHPEISVRWTLHDCWAFTGHCAYFSMARCDKWKTQCEHCPQLAAYPKSLLLDHSRSNYRYKRQTFTGAADLTLITPSQWLANLTRESFLREYPVEVVHNEIDHSVFKPTQGNVRERYRLGQAAYIVLGVAVGWEKSKGIQDMISLRAMLDDRYVIVLVGDLTGEVRKLPPGVVSIGRTKNQKELAQLYTAADVFINPTHQDNYPTVNLEANACGTVVLTYDVGGSPESALPENVVPEHDVAALAARVRAICESNSYSELNESEQFKTNSN